MLLRKPRARNPTPNGQMKKLSTKRCHFWTTRARTQALSVRILLPSPGGRSRCSMSHTCGCTDSRVVQIQTRSPSWREARICLEQQGAHPKSLLCQAPLQLQLPTCPILARERLKGSRLGVGERSSGKATAFQQPAQPFHPSPSWNVDAICGGEVAIL